MKNRNVFSDDAHMQQLAKALSEDLKSSLDSFGSEARVVGRSRTKLDPSKEPSICPKSKTTTKKQRAKLSKKK